MDNTQRFSNRVENYVKYRPHYPATIVTYLQERFDFTSGTIADTSRQGPSLSLMIPGYMPVGGSL